jgi:hypothetical protein
MPMLRFSLLCFTTLNLLSSWSQADPIPMKNCYILYENRTGSLQRNSNSYNSSLVTGGIQMGGWCQQHNGEWRWTDVERCQNGSVWNENGRLMCVGWGNEIQQGT